MKSKGFTLVELVVVVGLLAIATIVVTVNLVGMNNKQKQTEYERLVTKVENAAQTYVGLNINGIKDNVKSSKEVVITLKDLLREGLIDEEKLVDPRKNKEIPLTNEVIITYSDVTYEFGYNYNYE